MSTAQVQEPIENGNVIVANQITKLHDTVVALHHLSKSLEADESAGAAVIASMISEQVANSVCELETLL